MNTSAAPEIEDLRARFLNLEYDTRDFTIDATKSVTVAKASGEARAEFIDTGHPDFRIAPAYLASLASGRRLPIDFPALGGITMDGGKGVTCLQPVRPGVSLTGRTHLHDIYEKSGRSGRMVFIVARMEIYDAAGEHLATSDSRMVIREKSA